MTFLVICDIIKEVDFIEINWDVKMSVYLRICVFSSVINIFYGLAWLLHGESS